MLNRLQLYLNVICFRRWHAFGNELISQQGRAEYHDEYCARKLTRKDDDREEWEKKMDWNLSCERPTDVLAARNDDHAFETKIERDSLPFTGFPKTESYPQIFMRHTLTARSYANNRPDCYPLGTALPVPTVVVLTGPSGWSAAFEARDGHVDCFGNDFEGLGAGTVGGAVGIAVDSTAENDTAHGGGVCVRRELDATIFRVRTMARDEGGECYSFGDCAEVTETVFGVVGLVLVKSWLGGGGWRILCAFHHGGFIVGRGLLG
jgi:hypothetical protein